MSEAEILGILATLLFLLTHSAVGQQVLLALLLSSIWGSTAPECPLNGGAPGLSPSCLEPPPTSLRAPMLALQKLDWTDLGALPPSHPSSLCPNVASTVQLP